MQIHGQKEVPSEHVWLVAAMLEKSNHAIVALAASSVHLIAWTSRVPGGYRHNSLSRAASINLSLLTRERPLRD